MCYSSIMKQAIMPMVDYARKRSWNQPVLRDGGGGGGVKFIGQ